LRRVMFTLCGKGLSVARTIFGRRIQTGPLPDVAIASPAR
jgi:hypothetical protein